MSQNNIEDLETTPQHVMDIENFIEESVNELTDVTIDNDIEWALMVEKCETLLKRANKGLANQRGY